MRKVILLICLAFIVVCYGYPCFVLPVGAYEYKEEVLGVETTTTYEFKFDGTVKTTVKTGEVELPSVDAYYKLQGNNVIISLDDEFTDADTKLQISSMYKLGEAQNQIAFYITIGVGALMLLAIIWPSKR